MNKYILKIGNQNKWNKGTWKKQKIPRIEVNIIGRNFIHEIRCYKKLREKEFRNQCFNSRKNFKNQYNGQKTKLGKSP